MAVEQTHGQNVVDKLNEKIEWKFGISTRKDDGVEGSTVQINTRRSVGEKHFQISYITIFLAMKQQDEVTAAMKITTIEVTKRKKKKKVKKCCRVMNRTLKDKLNIEEKAMKDWKFDNTEYIVFLLAELYREGELDAFLTSPQWASMNLDVSKTRDKRNKEQKKKKGIWKRFQRFLTFSKEH